MFLNFQVVSEVYKDVYKDAKKRFEKTGELPPYAVVFASQMSIEPGEETLDLGEFTIPVKIATTQYGTTLEVPINNEDDESKSKSFKAVQVLAEIVGADCVLTIGEAWARWFDEPETEATEVILFSFQSQDGCYDVQIPILRKGEKVRLPNSPPPLKPTEVLAGRINCF